MKWMLKTPRGMELEKALDLAKKSGYDGAEIQLYDLPDKEQWRKDFTEQLREAEKRGMIVAIHAPSGDINLSSSNQGIRRESMRQIEETVRLAAEVKAASVTVHPGRLSSMREQREKQYGWMDEACRKVARLAKVERVHVGFENMELRPKEVFTSLRKLCGLLEPYRNPYIGVTLDFSHLWTVDQKLELSDLSQPIQNVHISQCVGGTPHYGLSVQDGELPLSHCLKLLRDRGYRGTVVVEAKDNVSEEGARANLEELRKAFDESGGEFI